jgi:predicted Zn-dependent protease
MKNRILLVAVLLFTPLSSLYGQHLASVTHAETARKLLTRLERFIRKTDKALGWSYFAQQMADILRHENRYTAMANEFENSKDFCKKGLLGSSISARALMLQRNSEDFPLKARSLIAVYSLSKLNDIVEAHALSDHVVTGCPLTY